MTEVPSVIVVSLGGHLPHDTEGKLFRMGNDATGKVVGDVRSTVISPRLGPIAIAMLRREVQAGDTVIVEGTDGPITAEVRELPFSE